MYRGPDLSDLVTDFWQHRDLPELLTLAHEPLLRGILSQMPLDGPASGLSSGDGVDSVCPAWHGFGRVPCWGAAAEDRLGPPQAPGDQRPEHQSMAQEIQLWPEKQNKTNGPSNQPSAIRRCEENGERGVISVEIRVNFWCPWNALFLENSHLFMEILRSSLRGAIEMGVTWS